MLKAAIGKSKRAIVVCGYIHEGIEPPDECPVCGAPKEMFDLIH